MERRRLYNIVLMGELLYAEVPPKALRETAGRLFGDLPFARQRTDLNRERWQWGHRYLSAVMGGEVPPQVFGAVIAEAQHAMAADERRHAERRQWRRHPVVRAVLGAFTRREGPACGSARPGLQIGGDAWLRKRSVEARLKLGKSLADLTCEVTEWGLGGVLEVAGRQFPLDPTATSLKVVLQYPLSGGTHADWVVQHKLPAYIDEVQTRAGVGPGICWSGVPCAPFTDTPAPNSYYMNRAMRMAAEHGQYELFR